MKKHIDAFIDFVVKDFWRILIALALSVFVYLTVLNQNMQEKTFSDVVVTLKAGDGIYIPTGDHLKVSVKVKGPERVINNLKSSDITGEITVTNKNKISEDPGKSTFKVDVTPSCFNTPPRGCQVVEIVSNASRICPEIQSESKKEVDVKVEVDTSAMAKGFTCSAESIPKKVVITGPEDVVAEIKEISTVAIKINPLLTEGFEQDVAIDNPDESVNVDPQKVKILCKIEPDGGSIPAAK